MGEALGRRLAHGRLAQRGEDGVAELRSGGGGQAQERPADGEARGGHAELGGGSSSGGEGVDRLAEIERRDHPGEGPDDGESQGQRQPEPEAFGPRADHQTEEVGQSRKGLVGGVGRRDRAIRRPGVGASHERPPRESNSSVDCTPPPGVSQSMRQPPSVCRAS